MVYLDLESVIEFRQNYAESFFCSYCLDNVSNSSSFSCRYWTKIEGSRKLPQQLGTLENLSFFFLIINILFLSSFQYIAGFQEKGR